MRHQKDSVQYFAYSKVLNRSNGMPEINYDRLNLRSLVEARTELRVNCPELVKLATFEAAEFYKNIWSWARDKFLWKTL